MVSKNMDAAAIAAADEYARGNEYVPGSNSINKRDINPNDDKFKKESDLGNVNLMQTSGNTIYITWWIAIALSILTLLGLIIIFSFIWNEEWYYDKNGNNSVGAKNWISSFTGVAITSLIIILAIVIMFVIMKQKYTNQLTREDAIFTNLARIGLEPLEDKQFKDALTDTIGVRANLNGRQKYLLRANLERGMQLNNSGFYSRILKIVDPDKSKELEKAKLDYLQLQERLKNELTSNLNRDQFVNIMTQTKNPNSFTAGKKSDGVTYPAGEEGFRQFYGNAYDRFNK